MNLTKITISDTYFNNTNRFRMSILDFAFDEYSTKFDNAWMLY